jgi:hypothetical protein
MLLRLATVLAFFASSVAAVPNLLESRAKCNADNCYRAVCVTALSSLHYTIAL